MGENQMELVQNSIIEPQIKELKTIASEKSFFKEAIKKLAYLKRIVSEERDRTSTYGPSMYGNKGITYNYEIYNKKEGFMDMYFSLPPIKNWIGELNKINKPLILDMGSGEGKEASEIKGQINNAGVVSLDISTYGSQSGKDIGLDQVQADINNPPFAEDKFDGIHCKDVLVHIVDKKNLFLNFSKLLKTNGVLMIVSSEISSGPTQNKWSLGELTEVASQNKLELVSTEKIKLDRKFEDWYKIGSNERVFMLFKKTE